MLILELNRRLIFSEASVFLVLGALGIYFEYGKINSYNKNEIDEEE